MLDNDEELDQENSTRTNRDGRRCQALYPPNIPGINNSNVILAEDVLLGNAVTGKTVVVIGEGIVGIETAIMLQDQGKKVSVLASVAGVFPFLSARRF